MKKLMLMSAIGMMAVSMASAINTCPTGSLSAAGYTTATGASNGFTCQIGNLQFSGFSETFSPNPGGIGPASLTVTPIVTPGNEGFTFTAFWSAVNIGGGPAGRNTEDSTIFFTVTDLAGALIHDLGVGFNGAFGGD